MSSDDWKAGYDAWKANEPASFDPTCDGCGEELHKCVCCDEEDFDELLDEDEPDEQAGELVAELKQLRLTVGRVERVLGGLEASVRLAVRVDVDGADDAALEERRNIAALLRAALGTAS